MTLGRDLASLRLDLASLPEQQMVTNLEIGYFGMRSGAALLLLLGSLLGSYVNIPIPLQQNAPLYWFPFPLSS